MRAGAQRWRQALQAFARRFAPAQIAEETQLEAQRGQPGIAAQRALGHDKAAGGQGSEAQREIGVKVNRIVWASAYRPLGRGDRLVGPVLVRQDDPSPGVGKCVIGIEFDGAIDRGQRRLVLTCQTCERKAGNP